MSIPVIMNDQTSHLISKMMDMAQQRQLVISNNIANANTPNYIRKDINFIDSLKDAIAENSASEIAAVKAEEFEDNAIIARDNGNNVVIASELNALMQNNISFNLLTKAFSTRLKIMRSAIK